MRTLLCVGTYAREDAIWRTGKRGENHCVVAAVSYVPRLALLKARLR